jgi:hypothetical protein
MACARHRRLHVRARRGHSRKGLAMRPNHVPRRFAPHATHRYAGIDDVTVDGLVHVFRDANEPWRLIRFSKRGHSDLTEGPRRPVCSTRAGAVTTSPFDSLQPRSLAFAYLRLALQRWPRPSSAAFASARPTWWAREREVGNEHHQCPHQMADAEGSG